VELVGIIRLILIGEAMLELRRRGDDWQMGRGGDTLNMALHLARQGHDVSYLTALGNDPFAADLLSRWRAEGLDTSLVIRHPARSTGLYALSTDASGERSFSYWRDNSAAREMFALPALAALVDRAARADMIGFSLITLAILPPKDREMLYALAKSVRDAGGHVACDGNYRPSLWANARAARTERDRAIALASVGLPTLGDETMLSGETYAAAVAAHWQGLGCNELVVKLGEQGCRLPDGRIAPPSALLSPVDTSGAGDAFNAGYLAARMRGESIDAAARAGHALAGWTIMRPGAIPDREP
jgi:2-dehydro-3-deoxygluconokinase